MCRFRAEIVCKRLGKTFRYDVCRPLAIVGQRVFVLTPQNKDCGMRIEVGVDSAGENMDLECDKCDPSTDVEFIFKYFLPWVID